MFGYRFCFIFGYFSMYDFVVWVWIEWGVVVVIEFYWKVVIQLKYLFDVMLFKQLFDLCWCVVVFVFSFQQWLDQFVDYLMVVVMCKVDVVFDKVFFVERCNDGV